MFNHFENAVCVRFHCDFVPLPLNEKFIRVSAQQIKRVSCVGNALAWSFIYVSMTIIHQDS